MRKITLLLLLLVAGSAVYAQNDSREQKRKEKEAKRLQRISLFSEMEEGENMYEREFSIGGRLNTNGWSGFLELAYRKNRDKVRYFQLEFSEIKHPKQDKTSLLYSDGFGLTSSSYFYGKKNNFYPVNIGYGIRRLIGGKAYKQGVEIQGIYYGGISLGLLKPYVLDVLDSTYNQRRYIHYTPETADLFTDPGNIYGSGGFTRGWEYVTLVPGLHAKLGVRFDWARFNHVVSALEVGVNAAYYTKTIDIMVLEEDKKFFLNAYLGIQFGKRWNK
ncbi:hypothetical protein COR50_21230 [Chitinophaga caeni]|uniref:Outer membrane protein beta-barrel domain-containing protein n=1 Tax=Chitinophaga caeni TaxID=2029983 RepID=A0A291QZY8_9BACT|nr:hypothetical protein [Chitinophaga caeni]ATL49495.1 hypothetical protein COR50_21230 [Chitinophaga caeni]